MHSHSIPRQFFFGSEVTDIAARPRTVEPDAVEPGAVEPRAIEPGAVELDALSLVDAGQIALNRIHLRLDAGKSLALVGTCARSRKALLECLEGLRPPCSGTARVLGVDVGRIGRLQREEIGSLRAGESLPPLLRVGQILACTDGGSALPGIALLSEALGLRALAARRVDTLAEADKAALKVWIALHRPRRLLLLEEPGCGLDLHRERALWRAIDWQCRTFGCSALVLTHSLDIATRCDGFAELDAGRLGPVRRRLPGITARARATDICAERSPRQIAPAVRSARPRSPLRATEGQPS